MAMADFQLRTRAHTYTHTHSGSAVVLKCAVNFSTAVIHQSFPIPILSPLIHSAPHLPPSRAHVTRDATETDPMASDDHTQHEI